MDGYVRVSNFKTSEKIFSPFKLAYFGAFFKYRQQSLWNAAWII